MKQEYKDQVGSISRETHQMYSQSLTRSLIVAACHPAAASRRSLVHPSCRLLALTTNSLATHDASNSDNVMTVQSLRARFDELANDKRIFPLLNKKQTVSFKKRVKWSENDRRAAVLVLVCNVDDKPSILFTRRSANLSQHAAEISFPGGHMENTETYEDAALRETCEELMPPQGFLGQVEMIGHTTKLPSIRGIPVTPVLAVTPNKLSDIHELFPGNPDEVDLVFSATVEDLVKNEGSHVIPNNRFGDIMAPTFATPHGKIWGLTAFILRPLLHKILKPVYLDGRENEGDENLSQNAEM